MILLLNHGLQKKTLFTILLLTVTLDSVAVRHHPNNDITFKMANTYLLLPQSLSAFAKLISDSTFYHFNSRKEVTAEQKSHLHLIGSDLYNNELTDAIARSHPEQPYIFDSTTPITNAIIRHLQSYPDTQKNEIAHTSATLFALIFQKLHHSKQTLNNLDESNKHYYRVKKYLVREIASTMKRNEHLELLESIK